MKLTTEQQRSLLREHAICANEACDACGKVLGYLRYTRRDQPGEWCSHVCRDGVEPSIRKRPVRGLVQREHPTVAQRLQARRAKAAARQARLRQRKTALQTSPNQSDIGVTFRSQASTPYLTHVTP